MKHAWKKCFVTAVNPGDVRNNNTRDKLKTALLDRNMKTSNTHVSTSSKKVKRFRSAFTTEQVTYLEREFRKYPYIGNTRRKDVASVLDIPERAVKIWFQNRRMKQKKDTVTKESDGESKRKVEAEEKLHFFFPKKDQALSLPQLTSPQILVTESFLNNVHQSDSNVESPTCLVQENIVDSGTFYQSKSDISSLVNDDSLPSYIQPDYISKDRERNMKREIGANKETSKMTLEYTQGSNVPSHQFSPRKVSERNLTVSPHSSTALPQDLSSYRKTERSHDQKLFKEVKESKQHHSLDLTSRTNSAAVDSPVYMRGYYTQPYMPPGSMIWKPVNMTPIMSTGSPVESANVTMPFGQPPLPNSSCTCDCHLKHNPVAYQQNGHNHLLQYFITAIPISGQPPI